MDFAVLTNSFQQTQLAGIAIDDHRHPRQQFILFRIVKAGLRPWKLGFQLLTIWRTVRPSIWTLC